MTVYLTEKAASKLRGFIYADGKPPTSEKGIRVAVNQGGCSGFEYVLNIVPNPDVDDVIYEQHDIKIYLDRDSAPILDGVVIDFIDSLAESGFIFENPNATEACSCGKSFAVAENTPAAIPCTTY
ncbi:iron-sulfur cluster assembly accessory protein [Euhalothece natronophila Z-M001]|uniref:Iron-sulfur cluster assembly accessory protein n=1 Tax=Euhalothece natronophila Z-M001 TaxID=522448 RepID=A0A5B8NIS0_9CHRO|nr:iron-sulfur cluster assembly accessory protein [Euhalothece natronophila]QDZ38848.1 iron-sulfur cluster assembly accessory protein [Euhalothece natronophila Z-M001]